MKAWFSAFLLVLSVNVNADVLGIGSWFEGAYLSSEHWVQEASNSTTAWITGAENSVSDAYEDTSAWIETAADNTWDWASHNPALAIIAGIGIAGVTAPILLSEVALTVITPLYLGWEFLVDDLAGTIIQIGAHIPKIQSGESLAAEIYEASPMATPDMFLQENSTNFVQTELRIGRVNGVFPSNPVKVASYGGVFAALILEAGYAAYNFGKSGVRWSENQLNEVIDIINDSSCWLVNGAHEECDDFKIGHVEVMADDKNETDNNSFFRQIVVQGEDFLVEPITIH